MACEPYYRDEPPAERSTHGHRGEPNERQCDWCERWSADAVDFAKIWFFCDDNCRTAWQANAPQNRPQPIEEPPF